MSWTQRAELATFSGIGALPRSYRCSWRVETPTFFAILGWGQPRRLRMSRSSAGFKRAGSYYVVAASGPAALRQQGFSPALAEGPATAYGYDTTEPAKDVNPRTFPGGRALERLTDTGGPLYARRSIPSKEPACASFR